MIIKLSKMEIEELTKDNFDQITESDRDEMAIPSYSHSNPLIRWLMWKRLELAFLLAKNGKDKTVLDFGCGIGVFLPTLDFHFTNVYAVDLFPYYAKKLCEKKGLKVDFKDSVNEFEDGSIDIIFSTDVLEHVDDLTELLNLLGKKMKSNGKLIISGPTENIVYRIGRLLAGFAGKGDYHHRNIDDIINTSIENGFEVQEVRYLPFKIPPYLFKVISFVKNK